MVYRSENWIMTFHSVGNFIFPTDLNSIIFQRGGEKPPTRYVGVRKNHDLSSNHEENRVIETIT
jgi:ribosomal protein L31E